MFRDSRQHGAKRFVFGRPHIARVAFAMKQDAARDPVDVGRFGVLGIVLRAQVVAHLVQKSPGCWL